eukprot:CAMPEP_0116126774 /NCGR_PEP_ID=MMETSP0329-20121206/6503_1 /TAXON_ID=697910 /ORGANISM="Pseudo-nitzschia arenysensis, Strain B593" /LENGTH=369 /DNA_ID=CAMNT_0003620863 /DNA_START=102 /DNA_END=1211 /DNA_ORIENTATION=+
MSSKNLDDWDDDDEEEDFVPDDYDDEGDDYDDDEEEEHESGGIPSVLEGKLFMDRSKGLCYEQDGVFCLVCKSAVSALNFPAEAPIKDSPLIFAGWINSPTNWLEFEVSFSEEPASDDPLQVQLLESQEQKQSQSRLPTASKTVYKIAEHDGMQKKSPAKGNLKDPPSYSLEGKSEFNDAQKSSPKDPTAGEGKASHKGFSKGTPAVRGDMVFVISGTQIETSGVDKTKINFRGAYRCPSKASVERLHLICPVEVLDGTQVTAVAAGGTAAVAAASAKRNTSKGDGDDDSVEGNVGVAYQELIDLHDDTRLSTEELRKRYYGSGDNKKGEYGKMDTVDNKRLKGSNGKGYPKQDVEEDDDDDDDDAYGF